MTTSATDIARARAAKVRVTPRMLCVDLADGRSIRVPLEWFPRLKPGSPTQRRDCRLIAGGGGIHWPQLDEDISVDNLLSGQHSGESRQSFGRWRKARGD